MNLKKILLDTKNSINSRSRRWDDPFEPQPSEERRSRQPNDAFDIPVALEKVRNGRFIGDVVQVADMSKAPIDVFDMTIVKFDHGRRVIVQDIQGFIHFVEPTWSLEASEGAVFVFQINPETKASAGWKREKNLSGDKLVQGDRRQKARRAA